MTVTSHPSDTLISWDSFLQSWKQSSAFQYSVDETVNATGYAPLDVKRQLQHVVNRCSATNMHDALVAEVGINLPIPSPKRVLVLAAATVPGLAIEGIAAALTIEADAYVRPADEDHVTETFVNELRGWSTELAHRVHLVDRDPARIEWESFDAAVVFGSDETLNVVHEKLPAGAAIAGYGSREGIAVLAPGVVDEGSWAERIADDVLTFRQRGCMSPSWLFTIGDEADTAPLIAAVEAALANGRSEHIAPGMSEKLSARHASDSEILNSITNGSAKLASEHTIEAGEARVKVVNCATVGDFQRRASELGSLLQTAVIAVGAEARQVISEAAIDAGCTRTCLAGDAHLPHQLWPQDGIGRIAPLLGLSVAAGA